MTIFCKSFLARAKKQLPSLQKVINYSCTWQSIWSLIELITLINDSAIAIFWCKLFQQFLPGVFALFVAPGRMRLSQQQSMRVNKEIFLFCVITCISTFKLFSNDPFIHSTFLVKKEHTRKGKAWATHRCFFLFLVFFNYSNCLVICHDLGKFNGYRWDNTSARVSDSNERHNCSMIWLYSMKRNQIFEFF